MEGVGAMNVFLPIADMSINFFLVIGIGAVVGFLSGLFGVGGGFLLTPLMMMIGIPPAVAAASDSNQIVASASSGALGHWRIGNVDIKMGITVLVGGITGGTLGVQVVHYLRAGGDFEFYMKLLYVLMLGTVGGAMFIESLNTILKAAGRKKEEERSEITKPKEGGFFQRLPLQTNYEKSGIKTSALFPFGAGFAVGFLAAMLGVGGGFIMVPTMIYIIGMPTITAIGTDLFQIVITSANVTFMQAWRNHTVDILLALTLLLGSTLGAQLGVRASKLFRGEQIRILLSIIVLAMMVKLLLDLVLAPDNLISFTRGPGGH